METFAERLRYYREKAKYNQKDLAEKINISVAAYNKYETRGNEPKIEILIKLANALGVDVNTLVGFQPNDKESIKIHLANFGIIVNTDENDSSIAVLTLAENEPPLIPGIDNNKLQIVISFAQLQELLKNAENDTDLLFEKSRHDYLKALLLKMLKRIACGQLFKAKKNLLIDGGANPELLEAVINAFLNNESINISPNIQPFENDSDIQKFLKLPPGLTLLQMANILINRKADAEDPPANDTPKAD